MKMNLQTSILVVSLSVFSLSCVNTQTGTTTSNFSDIDSETEASGNTTDNLSSTKPFDAEYTKYLNELNQSLIGSNVPFRYLTYEYDNGKFATYPFNLVLEELSTTGNKNPKYDNQYDKAFQRMVSTLDNSTNLLNKEIYAMGSQNEGMYVQDVDTKKIYVLNQICFDSRCLGSQIFYLFEPSTYTMVGMEYDGCNFQKNNISGTNQRMKVLLKSYIESLNPLDYSYAPHYCQ